MSAEDWSDLLGFGSGIALVYTAWRNDGLFAFVDSLRGALAKAKADKLPEDKKATSVVAALEGELAKWSGKDRWFLRGGVVLLLLSYGFKVGPSLWNAVIG